MHKLKFSQHLLYQLALLLIGLFVLLPIWELAYLAFDGGVLGWPKDFRLLPVEPTLQIFVKMWNQPGQTVSFLAALRNSLIVSGGSALLAVALGASMAYAFARFRFPGRQPGLFGLLFGALLPPTALMTPLYILLRGLNLGSTLLALMIVYASFAMPFAIWNMRAAFQSVSKELEEAAFLDGASRFTTFIRVTFPLALPAISIAALVAFLIGYTEFAIGWLFVQSASDVTLAMAITGIFNGNSVSWSSMAALSVMMSLPVVIVFIILQRSLSERMFLGAAGE
ncbi:MAG: carbohydrate ABC transporter permease [Chloroflexota bacterium]